jgi:hypothetical protein
MIAAVPGPAGARVSIAIGPVPERAAHDVADLLPTPIATAAATPGTVDGPATPVDVAVVGAGVVAGSRGWAWSAGPLPTDSGDRPDVARRQDDASTLVVTEPGDLEVRSGISGAQPVFVHITTDGGVLVASSPSALVHAGVAPATPDWDAWAQIIATGGVLGAASPFRGIRRLGPGEVLVVSRAAWPRIVDRDWEWREPGASNGGLDPIAQALDAAVERIAARGPLRTTLSGGWDSRVLAAMARRHDRDATTWTTSKDSGTAREELVARQVANLLGVQHKLVQPDPRRFAADLDEYARVVDHQTPYHVWLLPLAERLAERPAITLDGLGGGVFFGGAFPPKRGPGGAEERRCLQLLRYLHAAPGVLRPEVEAQLEARTRAAFDRIAMPLRGHPEVDALTAYLTRTLPGIALGPYGLMGSASSVATPFLDAEVVAASMCIPPRQRRDRSLYPSLLSRWSPPLAELATIAEPAPQRRRRARRSATRVTAGAFRHRLADHTVAELLTPELRGGDVGVWQAHLSSHADQHLLRSLWLLADWLDRFVPSATGLEALLEPT